MILAIDSNNNNHTKNTSNKLLITIIVVPSAENHSFLIVNLCWGDLVCSAENQGFLIAIVCWRHPGSTAATPQSFGGSGTASGPVLGPGDEIRVTKAWDPGATVMKNWPPDCCIGVYSYITVPQSGRPNPALR